MSARRGVPWFPIVSAAGVIAIGLVIVFCASALSSVPKGDLGANLPVPSVTATATPTP
jgi:hypothetical protein